MAQMNLSDVLPPGPPPRHPMSSFLSKKASSVTNYIRSQDKYGKPISMHYLGKPVFKTLPGGLLSMIIVMMIYLYTILKGKIML
jgi:hypothetical protein